MASTEEELNRKKIKEWFCVLTNFFALIPGIWALSYGQYMVAIVILSSGFLSLIYHLADSMDIYTILGKGQDSYGNYIYADFFLSQALFGSVILYNIIYDSNKISIGAETQIRGTLQLLNLIISALAVQKDRHGLKTILTIIGFAFSMHFVSWLVFLWFPLLQYDWIDFGIGLGFSVVGGFFFYWSNREEVDEKYYPVLHGLWHALVFIGILFFLNMRSQETTAIIFKVWTNPYNGKGQRV